MTALLTVLFKGETNSALVQLFRAIVMGGVGFVVDCGTLMLLHHGFGVHYLLAAAVGFCVGLATIYGSCVLWIFPERSCKSPVVEFAVFAALALVGLGITLLTMYLLVGHLKAMVIPSKVVATIITFAWNFVSRKTVLFSPRTEPQPS